MRLAVEAWENNFGGVLNKKRAAVFGILAYRLSWLGRMSFPTGVPQAGMLWERFSSTTPGPTLAGWLQIKASGTACTATLVLCACRPLSNRDSNYLIRATDRFPRGSPQPHPLGDCRSGIQTQSHPPPSLGAPTEPRLPCNSW